MLTQKQLDTLATETVLTLWARGHVATGWAKATARHLNIEIDFRQADTGATMVGEYVPTGEFIELEV
mgnify:CR=1 FL=1